MQTLIKLQYFLFLLHFFCLSLGTVQFLNVCMENDGVNQNGPLCHSHSLWWRRLEKLGPWYFARCTKERQWQ